MLAQISRFSLPSKLQAVTVNVSEMSLVQSAKLMPFGFTLAARIGAGRVGARDPAGKDTVGGPPSCVQTTAAEPLTEEASDCAWARLAHATTARTKAP